MLLRTERLTLRELELADAPFLNAWERDPESVRYTPHGVRTLAESEARIRASIDEAASVPRRVFDLAVVRNDDQRPIGRVGFGAGKPDEHQAMLWYVVDRSVWGSGYAVEAARAVVDFAFDDLGLHRVWLDADPRNHASLRVAEKLGMRREAHHVEDAFIQGEWTDTMIYATLRREWLALRNP